MKKVVVIGGGFAGAHIAQHLENDFAVTLIDCKDYFEFTPSVLRTLVEPAHVRKIQVRHKAYLHRAQVVKEMVQNITPLFVQAGRKTYAFDYLIICSGSSYNTPIKEEGLIVTARAEELQQYSHRLRKADHVLIVGGGLVGVELAAEIVTAYPEKKITIIHSGSELLERNSPSARKYAKTFLQKKGVSLVFNQRVVLNGNKTFTTDKGNIYSADLAFLCVGIKPNYEFLRVQCSTSLNEKHFLCVNSHLQVQGYKNIFAAGDITNVREEKTAQGAERQARIVVKNIRRHTCSLPLLSHIPKKLPMIISLGKYDGLFVWKNVTFTGLIPGLLKGFVEWKTMRRYRK